MKPHLEREKYDLWVWIFENFVDLNKIKNKKRKVKQSSAVYNDLICLKFQVEQYKLINSFKWKFESFKSVINLQIPVLI